MASKKIFSNARRGPAAPKSHSSRRKPSFMERRHIICRKTVAHPIPVRMLFIGWSTAHDGRQMAVYACPFPGCRQRLGLVQGPNGKPRILWSGRHDGRN